MTRVILHMWKSISINWTSNLPYMLTLMGTLESIGKSASNELVDLKPYPYSNDVISFEYGFSQ